MATAGVAVLLILSAPPLAVAAAARGALPGDPLAFLLVILVDILTFAVFLGTALHYRRRPAIHKRLMVWRWQACWGRPSVAGR
jgi:hypothetical protein